LNLFPSHDQTRKGMDPDSIEALYRSIDRLSDLMEQVIEILSDVYS